VDILDRIRKSKARNDKVTKVVKEMKQAGVKVLRDKEWKESIELILKEEKVYVPNDERLWAKVISLHHDTSVREHGGQ